MELNKENATTWHFQTPPRTSGTFLSPSHSSYPKSYQMSPFGILLPAENQNLFPWTWTSVGAKDWVQPLGSWSWQLGAEATPATTASQFIQQLTQLETQLGFAAKYNQLPRAKRERPVVGYRAWRTQKVQHLGREPEYELRSTGTPYTWQAGTNEALCKDGLYHNHGSPENQFQVPDPDCSCGFWVFNSLDRLEQEIDNVVRYDLVGAVMGWGKVVQHGDTGWRAQFVKPVALLDLKLGRQNTKLAHQVGVRYGMPVLEREALEWLVREHDGQLTAEAP